MKELKLTLKKEWFDLTLLGVKTDEFRKPSKWIQSRLEGKQYDTVRFTNGYGKDKPYIVCEFKRVNLCLESHVIQYKYHGVDSSPILVEQNDYIIRLGKIIETGNLNK